MQVPRPRVLRRLETGLRGALCALARLYQRCVMREWGGADLRRSALVFAPHADDETLGCGGTIIRKVRSGARVAIVFVTDSSFSHPRLMPPPKMKDLRVAEAREAARALGVPPDDVYFLELPDGKALEHRAEGVSRIAEILRRERPADVFVPHYYDRSPDHLATTNYVQEAVRACGLDAAVNEYPVWLWCNWPWIGLSDGLRQIPSNLVQSAVANWRLLRDCRCFVRVSDVLGEKQSALARHRTQMERYLPDPSWTTLADIADGDFLACLLRDREIFYRHRAGPPWHG